jgi:serine/threonine-protein kinase RsbW
VATVELSFSALPAHVRTARLVAAAVARRSGVDESVLDEVRLAVGEACSRAVDLHQRHCPHEPVRVRLSDGVDEFEVEVSDRAPVPAADGGSALAALQDATGVADPRALDGDGTGSASVDHGVGIAVISGLVDDVIVEPGARGTAVRMSWPAHPGA